MRVRDYFAGKNIFITGGSGFIGKGLINKLLRGCPDVGKIFILLRAKKGKNAQDRLKAIVGLPLFDKVREENPEALTKLQAINGDVLSLNLGMSEEDRALVTSECNILYHSAASVRFDDSLKYAIIMNVRGTREAAKLALDCHNLDAFMHISTTYCNIDRDVIEERIYPSLIDWRDAIDMAEGMEEICFQAFTLKCMEPHPNTYTFAKSLAEHVVEDMLKGKVPTVVLRPSVVISNISEDPVGWNDNFNGPVGLLVAGGKGLLRTVYGLPHSIQDYMPCDVLVKLIVLATKETLRNKNLDEVTVYNASKYKNVPSTVGEIVEMGKRLIWDTPYEQILWYPWFSMTKCWYDFYFKVLLYHMLPAVFLDTVLRIAGKKPMLVKIQRKIYIANVVLFHFLSHIWHFVNTRCFALTATLEDGRDEEEYKFEHFLTMSSEQVYAYYRESMVGTARWMFKEKCDTERNRRNTVRLYIVDRIFWTAFYGALLWVFFVRLDVLGVCWRSLCDYIERL